jgi:hypothetical protein
VRFTSCDNELGHVARDGVLAPIGHSHALMRRVFRLESVTHIEGGSWEV